ncbi:MAG: CPBP family glutamic-type intramembrane protease [Acidimicrobiales bacterium]
MGDARGPGTTAGAPGTPPPAWYRDPWGMAPLRWWNGQSWTPFTAGTPQGSASHRPVARPATPVEPSKRPRLTAEVLIVLGIFPFPYVVNALAALVQEAVHAGSTGRFPLPITSHLGLSFLFDLLLALEPLAAAALALYLLSNSEEGGSAVIGLDRSDPRQDLALLLPVFLLCFLVPEDGISLLLQVVHVHAIVPASQSLPDYFSIVGMVNALTAGVVEEIVVLGFLVRRLEQHGLRPAVVVALAVLVRVSYHVYYGWGVLPIAAWALASVLMYRRYRRLAPFIVVHVLWDTALILVPFFGGGPLGVEVLLLGPTTFAFWLMWRNRLATLPDPRSRPGWRAR